LIYNERASSKPANPRRRANVTWMIAAAVPPRSFFFERRKMEKLRHV
jgi:hypothetical protein